MSDAEALPRKCPTCGREIDPDDPTNVEGIEQQDHPAFGETHDYLDGFHYYFHAGCYPEGSLNWRRAD